MIKVIIELRSVFWNSKKFKDKIKQIPELGFLFSEGEFPVLWTSADGLPIITCWAGGGHIARLQNETDEVLAAKAIQSVAHAFLTTKEVIRKEILNVSVFNWLNREYIHGAYSYHTIHTKEAIKQINKPIDKKVFFAGEALADGGTVESALQSAEDVSKKIRSLM